MTMASLRLSTIEDDTPVKVSVEIPGPVYRNLAAYAEQMGPQAGKAAEPAKLIVPMIELFMKADRAFKPKRDRV